MSVPSEILDGVPVTGTKGTVTIDGVVYIIADEDLTPKWDSAEDMTAAGHPNRKRWVKGRYTLKLVLQLATSSTVYPPPGKTFTYAVKNEASAITFVIIEVPEKRDNTTGFIETVTITCESVVGTITVVA